MKTRMGAEGVGRGLFAVGLFWGQRGSEWKQGMRFTASGDFFSLQFFNYLFFFPLICPAKLDYGSRRFWDDAVQTGATQSERAQSS